MNARYGVNAALQAYLGHAKFKPTSRLSDDLGFDSLDMIEFLMEIEQVMDVSLMEDDYHVDMTVQEIIERVEFSLSSHVLQEVHQAWKAYVDSLDPVSSLPGYVSSEFKAGWQAGRRPGWWRRMDADPPPEETPILAFFPDLGVYRVAWDDEAGEWMVENGDYAERPLVGWTAPPTHWMPLPPVPEVPRA